MEKINLLQINPRDYDNKLLGPQDILPWFEAEKAFWQYQGEPSFKRPHAQLTSGLCSNGFFDCLRVLRYPNITEILGRQLAKKLRLRFEIENIKVDWVVSSPYAGITFGHEAAKALGAIFMMAEKDPTDPNTKKMVWPRMTIPTGANVLQVEELITTSGTLREVRGAVEKGNPEKPINFLPFVGALVYRPPELPIEHSGSQVIALITKEMQNFKPIDCPYCQVGSPRVQPKFHWRELIGDVRA